MYNNEFSDEINNKITGVICDEYQSLWIINVADKTMRLFDANEAKSVPGSIEIVSGFNSYPVAQKWYLEHCVAPHDKNRMATETTLENIVKKLSERPIYSIEYSRLSAEDENYNQLVYSALTAEAGKVSSFLLGFRDIDIRKKAERDDLTGLYTRQVFFQKSEELLKNNPDVQFDIMISDVVDFKNINETYGPAVGDAILKWTGSFLAPSISDDVIIGRYGGDQFAVMASHEFVSYFHSPEASASFKKQKNDTGLPATTVKFGVYENIRHDQSVLSICDKAHTALNSIKHQYGKQIAYYDEALKKELETNRKIENSMYQALEEEQFKVYYQPKHNALTGKLVGAEALVRWIHPEYGFMSPGEFIPLFEKNGFIVETDYYVWERTCKNLRKWQNMGLTTVPVSVNASKLTFMQDDLLLKLQSFVDSNGLNSSQLHIEITETLMTEDVDQLIRKLNAIRTVGYQIELDDFGAGYSSLNILSTLPLDVVKLDMSFMKQFGDAKRAKVLAACIKLAKELGYKTVSEGVEQKEQCDMLCILGVDAIQGYYYSKPLCEEDFEAYIRENM